MLVHLERKLRIFVFSAIVTPVDLDFVGKLYVDREHFRYDDLEIAYFTPDVSLAQIDADDLGGLADVYFEAQRARGEVFSQNSVWTMPDQVRSEARLWREFTRDAENSNKRRRYVDSLQAAVEVHGFPQAWFDDIRQGTGFHQFGDVTALATAV
ncbi:hypothetical protein [uncultured Maricaulis sp.]|uniref:hypothetical protein n=1 Tax=uncultured Maricaulis sp. TaxID=174710 RepID=UPI0030D91E8B|tara:strand:- start:68556 stop:69017 length:462 start_codon:yes stop_codon:yes gene_type:complete